MYLIRKGYEIQYPSALKTNVPLLAGSILCTFKFSLSFENSSKEIIGIGFEKGKLKQIEK